MDYTEALQRVMDANMPKVHKALRNCISEILEQYDLDFVDYPMKELVEIMKEEGLKNVEKPYLKGVLLQDFSLQPSEPKKYRYYDENNEDLSKTGRCYRFTRECLGLEPKTQTLKKEVSENEVINDNVDSPFIDSTIQNTKNLTKDLF